MRHAHPLDLRASLAAILSMLVLILLLPAAGLAHKAQVSGAHAAEHAAHAAKPGHRHGPPAAHDNGRGKVVGVMTRNLYLGADLGPRSPRKASENSSKPTGRFCAK